MAAPERATRSARPIKLVGRYAIFDRIAAGGMASVHLGRLVGAAGFSRTVAIKRLKKNFAKDPKFVQMFSDEARVAARIRHPNVAATIDVVSDGDELLLVLEYVHGESLSRLAKLCPPGEGIAPNIAVAVAVGALHGLHAAHEAKSERGEPLSIIHRDVSPQNILLGEDGVPRVVDFGVAKAAGLTQRTDSGHVKGKPRYMAPEQLEGDTMPIDHRVDIFSMGTVLWEALTGRKLFDHGTFVGVLTQVLRMPIPPIHEVAPHVPERLSQAVMRALSRDLATRYATAHDFAVALEDASASTGIATQTALSAWVRELASGILAERQALIEAIELRALSLRDPPAVADPDDAPEPSPRVERPSEGDLLAAMKTIKLPPKPRPPADFDPDADRPTLREAPSTLENRADVLPRTTDLLPPEPISSRPPPSSGVPVSGVRPAATEPHVPRIEVPRHAGGAAFSLPIDAEEPRHLPTPPERGSRRALWVVAGAILVAAAVAMLLVILRGH